MRLLAFIGALAIIAAVAAAIFFFGGYYSVAGTAPEPEIVKWLLVQVRKASVARNAEGTPSSVKFDDAAVMAGAKAFAARGCTNCHGGPGVEWAKFSEGLRPDPPDLKDIVKNREASQLFWVVKNGINMTGMPSFALAGVPDPEIWNIVAFLKKLPDVSDADYKKWTAPVAATPAPPMNMPMTPAPAPTPPAPPPDSTPPVVPLAPPPAPPPAPQ